MTQAASRPTFDVTHYTTTFITGTKGNISTLIIISTKYSNSIESMRRTADDLTATRLFLLQI